MCKPRLIPWLLMAAIALTACGGGSSWVESSASEPPAQSVPQEPAQSAMAPLPQLPDASAPGAGEPAASSAASSQPEPAAGQAPEAGQTPETPPAVVSKPPKVTPKPKPDPQPEPQTPDVSQPETPVNPDPEPVSEPEPDVRSAPTKADAQAYVGKSVSSLTAAIGAPKGSDYAPSCLGDGEDGELFYDGFTVYTYRENGKETVQAVE